MTVLTGKRVSNKKIAVKGHCLLSGHVSSFDDFTVLNYESHKFKRLIKDFLLVTKDKPLLNKKVRGDSNVNFRTQFVIITLAGGGLSLMTL